MQTATLPARSETSQSLVELLATARPGEIVRYEDIAEAAGIDCRPLTSGYQFLETARNAATKEHGVVFDAIDNVGLVCLDPEGVVKRGNYRRRKALTQVKLALAEQQTIAAEIHDMPEDVQQEYRANKALFEFLRVEASSRKHNARRQANITKMKAINISADLFEGM